MHVLGVGNVAFRSMLESFGVVMVLLVRSFSWLGDACFGVSIIVCWLMLQSC